ncbi:PTS sugar transporter subunit IIA [Streptococcus suis]|uniref:N-acetylgalactosamine-specific phosphotransferase system (PTS), IIA component n=3 Tax=Streptococcus suis TaxID=1307 RepID=A0A0H3MUU8_STRS4|nr:PTS sugar transporter subunit IIA [Streptococcus suis]ABP90187.1 Phosphotransferase system, mannose/fructose-specific component IIA [Streptococcus suis 05ZYH33]ABP92394.1 Phosphotransferase system, mannose/fructose-specific component IIA [Streptococcus suis 98HAH33]ADE31534.1 sugar-specific EII component protein [Streptococcus suis GZ1]ADV70260.1 phosphotransferase system, mannose/fructose-specific component IIA [Streptococcus suis JS14]AER15305.1 phosphotransferase system, mannose/fructose
MIKVIVVAHGQFASGILTSLKLIAGEVENIEAIDFSEGMSAQELKARIKSAILGEREVLILTDLLGGTPFKVSVELATEQKEQNVVVLSGLNLAMILEANFSRLTDDLEQLVGKLITTSKDGIVDSVSLLAEDNHDEELFEDGI